MTDADFIPHDAVSSRSDQERKQLWLRGCVGVGVLGLMAVLMVSVNMYRVYRAHQRPMLDVTPERINPNTASMAGLVRLPGIGKARAMDIIDYRKHQQDGPAFQSPQDMENIRGIGPKTAEKLAPWLTFEEEPEPRINTNEH